MSLRDLWPPHYFLSSSGTAPKHLPTSSICTVLRRTPESAILLSPGCPFHVEWTRAAAAQASKSTYNLATHFYPSVTSVSLTAFFTYRKGGPPPPEHVLTGLGVNIVRHMHYIWPCAYAFLTARVATANFDCIASSHHRRLKNHCHTIFGALNSPDGDITIQQTHPAFATFKSSNLAFHVRKRKQHCHFKHK
jgi:hypothetical protein